MDNLNNYFNLHICVHLSFHPLICPCVRKLAPIPAVVSQNVSNKSCLVCINNENYAFWVNVRTLRQGETMLRISKLTSMFHHFQCTAV